MTVYVVWQRAYGEDSRTRSLPDLIGVFASRARARRARRDNPVGYYREIKITRLTV